MADDSVHPLKRHDQAGFRQVVVIVDCCREHGVTCRTAFSRALVAAASPDGLCQRGRRGSPNSPDRFARWLLAGATINAFTQEIGVARVAGILLNEVDNDVARLDLLAANVDQRVKV